MGFSGGRESKLLGKHGLSASDVASVKLQATSAPWDKSGYSMHTRVAITAADGRVFDSGWIK
jgi:hypothetical protein